jgi:hypothetical protein
LQEVLVYRGGAASFELAISNYPASRAIWEDVVARFATPFDPTEAAGNFGLRDWHF